MVNQPKFLKTAVVTGACSGMGLALTRHLLPKGEGSEDRWQVVLADVNEASYSSIKEGLDPARHTFIKTDVSQWSAQVDLFREAFEWSGGRIDFFANNAGISDRQPLLGWLNEEDTYESQQQEEEQEGVFGDAKDLTKPNLSCIDVDLFAVFYAMKLYTYCVRKTKRVLSKKDPSTTRPYNPKMVVTTSVAGQYPYFLMPIYTAAKHGCVGLVRAAAPTLFEDEGIALNCILPGTVKTEIIPKPVLEQWPEEYLTPLDTIVRAFDELIDESGLVRGDGKSEGQNGQVKNGCSVECSADRLFYRQPVHYPDPVQEFCAEQSKRDGILGRFAQQMMAEHKKH